MILTEWAKRHNIPPHMIAELRLLMLGGDVTPDAPAAPGSEAAVQNAIRLEASRAGHRLFRNNVGVLRDDRGIPVRFGLANDSAALNKICKSSDLIGIKRVLITQDMVGSHIGQFLSREVKRSNWKYSGTEREVAQLAWINMVVALGGDAKFATGEGTL